MSIDATQCAPVVVALTVGLLTGCASIFGIEDLPPVADSIPADGATSDAVASAEVDAGPRHCELVQPRPTFCADFDGPELFEGFYNQGRVPNPGEVAGGTIAADSVRFSSAPRSVRFDLPPVTTNVQGASAFLVADLPALESSLVLYADLRIDTERFPDADGRLVLIELDYGPAIGAITVSRSASGTTLRVVDSVAKTLDKADFTSDLVVGEWQTLRILVHNFPNELDGGSRGDVVVIADGPVAKLPLPTVMQQVSKGIRLNVGPIVSRGPMAAFRMSVDNVRLEMSKP